MWVAFPMPQEVIEEHGDRWVEPGFIWTNGPMVLSKWAHDDSLQIIKNPNWWGADDVQIDVINGVMVVEASTAYSHVSFPMLWMCKERRKMKSMVSKPILCLSEELLIAPDVLHLLLWLREHQGTDGQSSRAPCPFCCY